MRILSGTTLGIVGVAMTFATAAAAGLHAPAGVWVAMLCVAGVLLVLAVLQHWRESKVSAAPPSQGEREMRVDALRAAYTKGAKLREDLVWGEGAPTSAAEATEANKRCKAKAREWGEETWMMLREHFPAYEGEFFGPGSRALGRTGFWLSAEEEMQHARADTYLGRKLALLERLLRQVDR